MTFLSLKPQTKTITPSKTLDLSLLLVTIACLSGCQSVETGPVIHRANSTFETTGIGKTKVAAQKDALANAKKTCGRQQVIVIKDSLKYNGVFDEQTGRVIDQVGSIAGVFLGKNSPDLSRDDDYEYEINFSCQ